MKMLKIFLVAAVCISTLAAHAQKTRTESFNVAGECGTCKKKIEKAAREAGATYAAWDMQSKILKVTYNAGTDVAAIQQRIADAGYDTPKFRATDVAYNSLDKCCQYDRQPIKTAANCCGSADCKMSAGSAGKDGKCADIAACKEKGCCKEDADCANKACCEKAAAGNKDAAAEKQ
jgi:periplasmic mercuric ion binding protein